MTSKVCNMHVSQITNKYMDLQMTSKVCNICVSQITNRYMDLQMTDKLCLGYCVGESDKTYDNNCNDIII